MMSEVIQNLSEIVTEFSDPCNVLKIKVKIVIELLELTNLYILVDCCQFWSI